MDSISSFDTTRLRSFTLIMLAFVVFKLLIVTQLLLNSCKSARSKRPRLFVCNRVCVCMFAQYASVTASVVIVGPLVTSLIVTRCAFAFFIVGSSRLSSAADKRQLQNPLKCGTLSYTLFFVFSIRQMHQFLVIA